MPSPLMLEALHTVLVGFYLLTLAILTVYGVHRYAQVYLYHKHRKNVPVPAGRFSELPSVTVQLPFLVPSACLVCEIPAAESPSE